MSKSSSYEIKDSGERRQFETGAVRDMSEGKGRFDLVCPFAIAALAEQTERGCRKYGERNWEKGIPQSSFIDSATRHLNRVGQGLEDEDHLLAAFWNLHCAVSQRERVARGLLSESLMDYPPSRNNGVAKDAVVPTLESDEDVWGLCEALEATGQIRCDDIACRSRECRELLLRLYRERRAGR